MFMDYVSISDSPNSCDIDYWTVEILLFHEVLQWDGDTVPTNLLGEP